MQFTPVSKRVLRRTTNAQMQELCGRPRSVNQWVAWGFITENSKAPHWLKVRRASCNNARASRIRQKNKNIDSPVGQGGRTRASTCENTRQTMDVGGGAHPVFDVVTFTYSWKRSGDTSNKSSLRQVHLANSAAVVHSSSQLSVLKALT